MFERIAKTFGALSVGQVILLLTQLSQPPVFIASYGVEGYGSWLVLTAAVAYLTVADFGLQTYIVNELTALYHRGEMGRFHLLQSTGLRMEIGGFLVLSVLASLVLFLPLNELLGLDLSPIETSLTAYFMILFLIWNIASGYFAQVFRAFGLAHRGAMWANAQRLLVLVSIISLVLVKAPFWAVALAQLLALAASSAPIIIDLKRKAPEAFPTLAYWDGALAKSILKPSAFFGLFTFNNFLLFQAPVLVLNHFLGASAVVVFTVTRTIFSMVRQGVAMLQAALAPEITRLNGIRDQLRLARLYKLSESIALSTSLVFNTGTLVLAPLLLSVWLGRPELFSLSTCTMMATVSILMSVKEYKLYFQYATNNHVQTATITSLTYLVMVALSVPAIQFFGLAGFMFTWICVEFVQIVFIHLFNIALLDVPETISPYPVVKLVVGLVPALLLAGLLLQDVAYDSHALQIVGAAGLMLALSVASYFVFRLNKVRHELTLHRARRKSAEV